MISEKPVLDNKNDRDISRFKRKTFRVGSPLPDDAEAVAAEGVATNEIVVEQPQNVVPINETVQISRTKRVVDLSSISNLPLSPTERDANAYAMNASRLKSIAQHPSHVVVVKNDQSEREIVFPGECQTKGPVMASLTSKKNKNGNLVVSAEIWVAHSVAVDRIIHDENSDETWVVVSYFPCGKTKPEDRKEIKARMLEWNSDDVKGPWEEMRKHMMFDKRAFYRLKEYVSLCVQQGLISNNLKTERGTSLIGWNGDFTKYFRPGFMSDTTYENLHTGGYKWNTEGSPEVQASVLRSVLDSSPRALAVCGFAVSSLLLRVIGIEQNYILAMVGPNSSSRGKTSLLKIIKSLFDNPSNLRNMNSTQHAVSDIALSCDDSTVIFDEIGAGVLKEGEAERLIYDLSEGTKRSRLAKKNGEFFVNEEGDQSRYMAIFAGETSLINTIGTKPGLLIRYTEMSVGDKNDEWLFGFDDRELITHARSSLSENYGHIYPEIVKNIIADGRHDVKARFNEAYFESSRRIEKQTRSSSKAERKAEISALTKLGIHYLCEVIGDLSCRADAELVADAFVDDFEADFEDEDKPEDVFLSLAERLSPRLSSEKFDSSNNKIGYYYPTSGGVLGSIWAGQKRHIVELADGLKSFASYPKNKRVLQEAVTGTILCLKGKEASDYLKSAYDINMKQMIEYARSQGYLNVHLEGDKVKNTTMGKIITPSGDIVNAKVYEFFIPDALMKNQADASDGRSSTEVDDENEEPIRAPSFSKVEQIPPKSDFYKSEAEIIDAEVIIEDERSESVFIPFNDSDEIPF